MNIVDIRNHRLANQLIAASDCERPGEVVKHLVAVQAQEYAQAKWAIGLRMNTATHSLVEQAFNSGAILRTHVLRPTWHFVCPEDIRWLLELTAPRVHAFNAPYYLKAELDNKTLVRATNVVSKSLQGNNHLTRKELQSDLQKAKIIANGLRLTLVMMYAELERVICSGPRKGNQFTYALMDERVPATKSKSRDEALAELAQRYFSSHGPATVNDFAWWSGLTVKECRQGVAMVDTLVKEVIDGVEYCLQPANLTKSKSWQRTFLMPDYDEYGISYKDRSAIYNGLNKPNSPVPNHMLVIDGIIAGTWKRNTKAGRVTAEASTFDKLIATRESAVKKAIRRYNDFMLR